MTDEDVMAEIDLRHEPARPCRPTVYGEGIYVEHWQRQLEKRVKHGDGYPNEMVCHILGNMWGPLTQRHATVAASMFCWFGTNCGRCYLESAKKLGAQLAASGIPFADLSRAYFWQWQLENSRTMYINRGIRTLEFLVGGGDDKIAELTALDFEVADAVVSWLGTPDGQELMKSAEDEIAETRRILHDQTSMEHRARMRALGLAGQNVF